MAAVEGDPHEGGVPRRFVVDFAGATLLGIYRVDGKLAEGGMGTVYRGENTNLGAPVVVKVPHVRLLGERGFALRFRREIADLVRLRHPHVVRIQAQGEHEGIPFFVLDCLEGGSLASRLRASPRRRQDLEEVLSWLRPVAETLDFVHLQGVVHRDVKPGNILFDEHGHVFLSDFGIAKVLEGDRSDLTGTGLGMGSPHYMAPEQAMGRDVVPASDQYALAATAYEALGGRPPFEGGTPQEVIVAKETRDPPLLGERVGGLPAGVAEALGRALSRDPGARHPRCVALVEAMEGAGRREEAAPPSDPGGRGEMGVTSVHVAAPTPTAEPALPPLPDPSADRPYREYLARKTSMWTSTDPHHLRGPLPVHPDAMVEECQRLLANPQLYPSVPFEWMRRALRSAQMPLLNRLRSCLDGLERWALVRPEYRHAFRSLWNQAAGPLGVEEIGPGHFEGEAVGPRPAEPASPPLAPAAPPAIATPAPPRRPTPSPAPRATTPPPIPLPAPTTDPRSLEVEIEVLLDEGPEGFGAHSAGVRVLYAGLSTFSMGVFALILYLVRWPRREQVRQREARLQACLAELRRHAARRPGLRATLEAAIAERERIRSKVRRSRSTTAVLCVLGPLLLFGATGIPQLLRLLA